MGRREDFKRIMNHRQPERLLIDFGGNPLSTMEGRSQQHLLDYLGLDSGMSAEPVLFGRTRPVDERILRHYDTDTRAVGRILTPPDSQFCIHSSTRYTDEWGIERVFTGMYWESINTPLKDATTDDLEHYRWPDPDSIPEQELERIALRARELYEDTDYVVCAEHPVYGIFELGCWLCGFDDFLYRMLAEPEFVQRCFEIFYDYQRRVIQRYYSHIGRYIHYTSSGDDFATQNAMFMSPELFRQQILPVFRSRVELTKTFTNAAFLHHSCGSVYPVIADLAAAGVDILNPIQPKAKDMSPQKLKQAYGDLIVFHGGVDTQDILPFGTVESIRSSVCHTVEADRKSVV